MCDYLHLRCPYLKCLGTTLRKITINLQNLYYSRYVLDILNLKNNVLPHANSFKTFPNFLKNAILKFELIVFDYKIISVNLNN